MVSSASRSGRRCEPRGDVRFLSRLILEAMPRRSVERRDGGMSAPTSARAPFGSRKVQSAAATRRVVAERTWGLWNETRHKPASRQAIFASRPARKCGLLNTILSERGARRGRIRLETRENVSQKSLLIPVSQKLIIQTSCER